ncbi:MAG: DNA polymerase/3'-5' exonuclease PolX [Bacillus sp. (in: Bacteria)]|jgi:DNA polymerase (family X)|nr:DNA polymerase/3'-5' exonuclease PolX [Bacillus sp. (in: firmicutes)]
MVTKKDVIRLLERIALYMELKGENPFKISAFRKAAQSLETDARSLTEITDFTKLPGIGKGTAAVIQEYIETGSSEVLEGLQKEVPEGLIPLLQLPGVGGKKLSKLYHELGVIDAETLKQACEEGKVQKLAGFGKKTEEKLLAALEQFGKRPERLPIAFMLPIVETLERKLKQFDGIEKFSRAGSIRRIKETIKDIDFIIATKEPEKVKEQLLQLERIKEAVSNGPTKVSLTFAYDYDVNVDFRLVAPEQFATALHHFTGSKEHNVRMRQLAKERGEKISEYGVEDMNTGHIQTFSSEEAFFNHFSLPFIPPEMRESGEEIERILEQPAYLSLSDIRGDLHMHSTWSDGAHSIEEMVEACRKRGYQYLAITDHSQFLKVASGLTKERWYKQREEIQRLNEKYDDITILTGIEMDILPDGSLDFEDDVIQEMDVVIASIHSHFQQPKEKIMERLKTALSSQHVDIIAHPTGRLIGRRDGYDVNIDLLIQLAKETNTALELNANPHRLDLCVEHLQKAQYAGVKVVINTDAHHINHLSFMELGVSVGRKAWLKKETVLNTYNIDELKNFLKRHDEQ